MKTQTQVTFNQFSTLLSEEIIKRLKDYSIALEPTALIQSHKTKFEQVLVVKKQKTERLPFAQVFYLDAYFEEFQKSQDINLIAYELIHQLHDTMQLLHTDTFDSSILLDWKKAKPNISRCLMNTSFATLDLNEYVHYSPIPGLVAIFKVFSPDNQWSLTISNHMLEQLWGKSLHDLIQVSAQNETRLFPFVIQSLDYCFDNMDQSDGLEWKHVFETDYNMFAVRSPNPVDDNLNIALLDDDLLKRFSDEKGNFLVMAISQSVLFFIVEDKVQRCDIERILHMILKNNEIFCLDKRELILKVFQYDSQKHRLF